VCACGHSRFAANFTGAVYVFAAVCRSWLLRGCAVVIAVVAGQVWFGGGSVIVGEGTEV